MVRSGGPLLDLDKPTGYIALENEPCDCRRCLAQANTIEKVRFAKDARISCDEVIARAAKRSMTFVSPSDWPRKATGTSSATSLRQCRRWS